MNTNKVHMGCYIADGHYTQSYFHRIKKMRKLIQTVRVLFLMSVFCIAMLGGCETQVEGEVESPWVPRTVADLDEGIRDRILQDYFDQFIRRQYPEATIDDIWVDGYDGTFRGNVVVNIKHSWGWPLPAWGDAFGITMRQLSDEVFQGVRFRFHNKDAPIIWNNGSFSHLLFPLHPLNLWVSSWRDFTQCELKKIATHNTRGFCTETEKLVVRYFNKNINQTGRSINEAGFLGSHNGSIIVTFDTNSSTTEYTYNIGGKNFHSSGSIFAWKNGHLHCIADIYKQNMLTIKDISLIFSIYFEKRLFQDLSSYTFFALFSNLVRVLYHGTFNEVIVLMFPVPPSNPFWDVPTFIAGKRFEMTIGSSPIMTWKAGEVHELGAAYNLNLLTTDDIKAISYIHNDLFWEVWR